MKFGKILSGIDNGTEKTKDFIDQVGDSFRRDKMYFDRMRKGEGNPVKNAAHVLFKDGQPRDINNLYTGHSLSATGKTAVGIGVGVYLADNLTDLKLEAKERARNGYVEQQQEELDIESPLASRADGQGYQIDTSQLLANVQSQGDLVFALNKTRNGGYL